MTDYELAEQIEQFARNHIEMTRATAARAGDGPNRYFGLGHLELFGASAAAFRIGEHPFFGPRWTSI